jgi:RimJ/RimL family protein N-acetyltransferase
MPNGLLIGEDQLVANWMFDTFHVFRSHVDAAIGILSNEGKIVGAAVFQNFNGSNVELSYYGPKTLTLGIVRALAKATLAAFNANRVTVVTSQRNRIFMRGLVKMGFKLEGHQRCYYGREDTKRNNGVRFVMFRDTIDSLATGKRIVDALQPTSRLPSPVHK